MAHSKWEWVSSSAELLTDGRRERPMVYRVIDNIIKDRRHKNAYKTVQRFIDPHTPTDMEILKRTMKINNMETEKPKKNNMKEEDDE